MTDQVIETIEQNTTDADDLFLEGLDVGELSEETEIIEEFKDDKSEDIIDEEEIGDSKDNKPEGLDDKGKENLQKDFMEVKFKGKTQTVSKDEAIILAQKGMNYDSIYEENNLLKHERAQLDNLAHEAGVTTSEYLKQMANFQRQSLINQASAKIKEAYPDSPDELVEKIAADQVERYFESKKVKAGQNDADSSKRERLVADIAKVEEEFKDVDLNNLPETVVEDMKQGYGLYEAICRSEKNKLIEENKKKEEENKAKEKNKENSYKATGKIEQKSNGPVDDDDLFLVGFNS